jgi:hypothetical protein
MDDMVCGELSRADGTVGLNVDLYGEPQQIVGGYNTSESVWQEASALDVSLLPLWKGNLQQKKKS